MKHKTFQFILYFLVFLFFPFNAASKDVSFYASNSVLATGNWYKIRVSSDGIYKLTYDDLVKMGISNPDHVQIRGYGGWMLDEDFSTTYYDDLPEVAVWMNKGADNIFNSGDYILFYARGPVKWTRTGNEFVQTNNAYSDYGYYFVSEGSTEPLQMDTSSSVNPSQTTVDVTTYSDYMLHEQNSVNLLESGKEFYGESFYSTLSRNITMNIPGIVSWLGYNLNFIAKPSSTVNLGLSLNGTNLFTQSIGSNTNYYSAGTIISKYISGTSATQQNNVFNISLDTYSVTNSYLNFLRVYFKRTLQPYDVVTFFRNDVATQNNNYQIANANQQMMVFDVTGNLTPTIEQTTFNSGVMSFTDDASMQHEYALVDLTKTIPIPDIIGKINNQNLHALQKADFIIISQPVYHDYAEQIAKAHFEKSGLTYLIVDPNQIYNEFSSGNPDATAYRRFLKMFYDRGTSDVDRPKYLLLFGGGCYDNKFITSNWNDDEKNGYLLTYQSDNSSNETSSYTTDDYFGFLSGDGSLNIASAKLDIGIGRLPARDKSDVETYVSKILNYMGNSTPGIWQNNLMFVADDAVGATGYSPITEMSHETQSDKYAEYVQTNYPDFIVNKIYEDSYRRVVQSNGNSYPDAHADIIKNLNSGQLILNYVGHGSTRDWSHEYVMRYHDFEDLSNTHLPLWITATCDFSRFDSKNTSGGEVVLSNAKGGGIALMSTVRVVYIANNDSMSMNTYRNIFKRDNGKALRLGDIIKNTKNSFINSDDNKSRYLLFGDPALRLSYPADSFRVKVTDINGIDVSSQSVNIQALSNVKINGQIVDRNNNLVNDFNGKVSTVVFDAQQNVQTRDNGGDGSIFYYKNYLNKLYSGTLTVKDGTFNCDFITPKDIMYTSNNGKMSFYAWDSNNRGAQGAFQNYTVNGTDTTAVQDTNGPSIDSIYLNVPTFVSGDKVNTTPMFHVSLSDESGVNLSGGIGHTIDLIIDGETEYDLTSYFVSSGSSTKDGYINYSIPELSEGKHTLKFAVWDVMDNYSEKSVDFFVTNDYKAVVTSFSLAKNPVNSNATFLFSSNVPGSTISVRYDVYSMNGMLMWTHEESGSSDLMNNYSYDWNLETNSGMRIRPGIYICRATISIDGVQHSSKSVKLLVLAQ